MQLIPDLVWKGFFSHYKKAFPECEFQEDTLKERLRETLRELKIGMANEEGQDKVVLQNDDYLVALRANNSHAAKNILKMRDEIVRGKTLANSSLDHSKRLAKLWT